MKGLDLVLVGCVLILFVTGSLGASSSAVSTTPAATQPTATPSAGQGSSTTLGSGDTTTPSGAGAITASLLLPLTTAVLGVVMGVLRRQ